MPFDTEDAKLWMVTSLPAPGIVDSEESDTFVLQCDELTPADFGYDSHVFTYQGLSRKTSREIAALWTPGDAAPSGSNMFIQTATPRRLCGPVWEVDVLCRGVIDPDKILTRLVSSMEEQSASNITIDFLTYGRVSAKNRSVGLEVGAWMDPYDFTDLIGTEISPSTIFTGMSGNPGPVNTPTPPTNIWTSLSDFTFHYPNGWILESVAPEPLHNGSNDKRWCVFTFGHQFDVTP